MEILGIPFGDKIEGLYVGDHRLRRLADECLTGLNGRLKIETVQEGDYTRDMTIRAVTYLRLDGKDIVRSVWEQKYVDVNGFPRIDTQKSVRRTVKMVDCPEADRIFGYLRESCRVDNREERD